MIPLSRPSDIPLFQRAVRLALSRADRRVARHLAILRQLPLSLTANARAACRTPIAHVEDYNARMQHEHPAPRKPPNAGWLVLTRVIARVALGCGLLLLLASLFVLVLALLGGGLGALVFGGLALGGAVVGAWLTIATTLVLLGKKSGRPAAIACSATTLIIAGLLFIGGLRPWSDLFDRDRHITGYRKVDGQYVPMGSPDPAYAWSLGILGGIAGLNALVLGSMFLPGVAAAASARHDACRSESDHDEEGGARPRPSVEATRARSPGSVDRSSGGRVS